MAASQGNRVPIANSAHPPKKGARVVGRPEAETRSEVTVYLRPRSEHTRGAACQGDHPREHLTHGDYAALHGAKEEDIETVRQFATDHSLRVVEACALRRMVKLEGTTENLNTAFGVDLVHFEHDEGQHRGHEGEIHLPAEIHEIALGVLGLDNRPVCRRMVAPDAGGGDAVGPDNLPDGAFTPPQIAKAYDFPEGLDGSGECIAFIELGGGYYTEEFQTYFDGLGIPMPEIVSVGPNNPEEDKRINTEVALDLEVSASIAPGAKYVFYFGENTGNGFIDTVAKAIMDKENSPSIISISWSAPEVDWPENGAQIMEHNIQAAASMGITVCIGSGDLGAQEGLEDGKIAPSFPSCVPSALSCGGTMLVAPDSKYESEIIWNRLDEDRGATGGGVSCYFKLPSYQEDADVPVVPEEGANPGFAGRGLPDVAGVADPESGYLIYVNGEWMVKGGTSAVGPLWAALIAMMNQKLGRRVGFLNNLLYGLKGSDVFRQVTSGNNGYYEGKPGWNACTGLGTPVGTKLLAVLEDIWGAKK